MEALGRLVETTDLGNSARFVDRYGEWIRYCGPLGWLAWDGKKWTEDSSKISGEGGVVRHWASEVGDVVEREATELAGQIDWEASGEADDRSNKAKKARWKELCQWARTSRMEPRMRATLCVAASNPEIQIEADQLNRDPEIVNTRFQLLDLMSHKTWPHNPVKMCTHIMGTGIDGQIEDFGSDLDRWRVKCPNWVQFLLDIFQNDYGFVQSVQQMIGYSLSGYTSEQCIFLCYGIGRNGKSTLMHVLSELGGGYSGALPAETFAVKQHPGSGIGEELASVATKRIVTAHETESSHRLAQALVKRLTGGDIITCRKLYAREWLQFVPKFKVWFLTNHKPTLDGVDLAIKRRIKMIPFNVQISPEREIPEHVMKERFRDEMPGIFQWALSGFTQWWQNGQKIDWAKQIVDASCDFFEEQDLIGQFIDECMTIEPTGHVGFTETYERYSTWCKSNGNKPLQMRKFSIKMCEKRFIKKVRHSDGMHFAGVRLYGRQPTSWYATRADDDDPGF